MDLRLLGSRYHHLRLLASATATVGLLVLGFVAWRPALFAAGAIAAIGVHAYWRKRSSISALESLLVDTTVVIVALAILEPPIAVGMAPVVALSTTAVLFLGDRRALAVAAYASLGIALGLTWGHFDNSVVWSPVESLVLIALSVGATAPLMWWLLKQTSRSHSERRALQMRLKERESRYRMITESVSDAIVTTDGQGLILYANPAVERIFGYVPDELTGEDLGVLIPERHRAMHRLRMLKYTTSGQRSQDWNVMSLVGLHRDGRELDLEVSFGESSALEGKRFIGTFRDMTERRAASEALEMSETRYRELFEGVPVGVYRTSATGEIVDANPMLAELLGYDIPADVIGLPARSFYVDPAARDVWRQNIEERSVLAGHEIQLRRPDGSTIWVRDSGREIRDDQDRVLGYEGTLEDVTLRREAEERLRWILADQQQRLLYEKALSACSQALLGGSDDTALEVAFETLLEATGASAVFVERNEMDPVAGLMTNLVYEINDLGMEPAYDHWSAVPWADMPQAHAHLSRGEPYAFGVEELVGLERQLYEDDLTRSELDIPIFVGQEWTGVIGFADFQSERQWRDDEIALLRTTAQMIGSFWERRQAHEKLQELVHYKDEFVASVSHELRTPLTAVVGLAEELAGASPDTFSAEELIEFHELIAQQSREVAFIVEDLLVAARVDIDKVSVDMQPVDLDAEVAATIEGWHSEFGHVEQSPGDVKVMADPVRFRQVIRNLLTNAIRYGGDRIQVVTKSHAPFGILQVRDNGSGISSDDLERIFEPYERASDARTVKPGSVGLGLYVSRQLARLMGGDLSCRRDGPETVFELVLPLL